MYVNQIEADPMADLATILLEAEGYAELALWEEAWDTLESLPPAFRRTEDALRITLSCCPYKGLWDLGDEIVSRFREGSREDRILCSSFHFLQTLRYIELGIEDVALTHFDHAIESWPEVKKELMAEPSVLAMLIRSS